MWKLLFTKFSANLGAALQILSNTVKTYVLIYKVLFHSYIMSCSREVSSGDRTVELIETLVGGVLCMGAWRTYSLCLSLDFNEACTYVIWC